MEVLLGFVDVVRTAAELNVLHAGGTAGGVRLDVVELEERALDAAAVRADEGALALVPPPHSAAHGRWNVSRPSRRGTGCAWVLDRGVLGAFEIADDQRKRAIDHRRQVAGRDRMTQQILGAAQLVVRLPRDGDSSGD